MLRQKWNNLGVSERFRQNEGLGSVKSLDVFPLFCITCATSRPRRQEEQQLRAAGVAATPAAESRAASAPKAEATAAKAQAPKAKAKAAQVGTSSRDDGRMMAE